MAAGDYEAAALSAGLQRVWGMEAMAALLQRGGDNEPGYGRWLAKSAGLTCSARVAGEFLSRYPRACGRPQCAAHSWRYRGLRLKIG